MGSNNNSPGNQNGGGGHQHDGQKNYQHSNQRNPDNVRNDTRKNQYEDYEEKLTNDENFEDGKAVENEDDMDFRDKQNNLESDDTK